MQMEPLSGLFEPRTSAELIENYSRVRKVFRPAPEPPRIRPNDDDDEKFWRSEAERLEREVLSLTMKLRDREAIIERMSGAVLSDRPVRTDIVRAVATYCQIPLDELRGPGRPKELRDPRRLAGWLMVRKFGYSLTEAGRALNRDHTTVLHAIREYTRDEVAEAAVLTMLGISDLSEGG